MKGQNHYRNQWHGKSVPQVYSDEIADSKETQVVDDNFSIVARRDLAA